MEFSEKLLYHIWDAQHLVKNLETVSGKRILVMYAGQWNSDIGPDFRNLIIEIDGNVVRGDGEIHLCTYDWIAHHHNEDENYNKVILHIVYEHNGQYPLTITENGSQIEILELKNYLDEDITKLIKRYEEIPYDHHPDFCPFFAGLDEPTTSLILTRLGTLRMEKKIKRYAAELYFSDFNQLLYQGIMEAAGYNKNSYNFLQLAINYPYVNLTRWQQEGMGYDDLLSIWLYGSGLIAHLPGTVGEEERKRWEEHYKQQKYSRKKLELKWNLFRLRPVNHPVIRLLQIVELIYESLNDSLLNEIINIFAFSTNSEIIKELRARMKSMFDNEKLPRFYRIGQDRLDIILINVFIPIMILFGEKMGYQELKTKGWEIYREFKGLPSNYIEDLIGKKYLNIPQQRLIRQKAIYQQGILKIYNDYCRYHNCKFCETYKKNLILSM
jgi:hypothetical protein